MRDRHLDFRPPRKKRLEDSPADLTVQPTDAVNGAAAMDCEVRHIKRLGGIAGGRGGQTPGDPRIEIERPSSAYFLRYHSIRPGSKRSKPAATGVWVVNRLPARVTVSARSNGCLLSIM